MLMKSRDQSKGFAFKTAPQHVTKELVKLNGVQFQDKCLIVEEAKCRRMSNVPSNLHTRPHVINNSSKMKIPSQGTTLFLVMSLMRMLLSVLKDLLPDIDKTVL